ncbi:MAG: phosphoglycerate kinase [Sandaracinaceae bacterium]|nr:phosphoglycerate kinase [Sandaracinaceae bacterium]
MSIRTIDDLEVAGRRVFVRVDFNVPLSDGEITDDSRIRAALPTLRALIERGAKLILASHLGRPKGKPRPELSLEPVALKLAELLSLDEVILPDDCIGDGAKKVVSDLRDGGVVLLENLRFHPGEEANDPAFARELAVLAEIYVNDAFGAAHRAHASVSALPQLMEFRAAGYLMKAELAALTRIQDDPPRPFYAVLGGAKVSDKIGVIEALMKRVDGILIGGAMANTFLAARGASLGKSLVEDDKLALARTLLQKADDAGIAIHLPRDLRVGASIEATEGRVVGIDEVGEEEMALDIGPATLRAYQEALFGAGGVFWNGPMGLFENPAFAEGTLGVARLLAESKAFTVVGGGDSVAAINQSGLADRFDHVSTGGGASLEFLEGKKMPGVEALR